jgi:beta-alanine--pyruvate transaminase
MVKAFEAGLTVRMAGDFIALSPPLIIDAAQIQQIADILRAVISSLD